MLLLNFSYSSLLFVMKLYIRHQGCLKVMLMPYQIWCDSNEKKCKDFKMTINKSVALFKLSLWPQTIFIYVYDLSPYNIMTIAVSSFNQ